MVALEGSMTLFNEEEYSAIYDLYLRTCIALEFAA